MSPDSKISPTEKRNFLERGLTTFAEVHAGEGLTAILLMLNLFLLLAAYLIIKTVREPLILAEGGAVVKSYAAAGQALLLLIIVPIYSSLASKVNRNKLINWVTVFFISNLMVFYILAQFRVALGVAFFLWVGIFNLFVIAQFWSFANDIYTQEQGKRLFAIVAFGGSMGAILGPGVAGWLFEPLGAYQLMLVSAGILGICIVITNFVNIREKRRSQVAVKKEDIEKPLGKEGGFKLVMGQRYLLLIALLMLVLNLVNTTGEFILGKTVTAEAQKVVAMEEERVVASGVSEGLTEADRKKIKLDFIAKFYANFFFWVNLLAAMVQLFLVSRILKYFGVAAALFFLPIVALGAYSIMALIPILSFVKFVKILENSTDYSLQNTARQALFLPTSREAKYKAKAAIDTFFVRIGDVLSAVLVYVGVQIALATSGFAAINIVLVFVWLLLILGIVREYKKLTSTEADEQAALTR
ncbi:MAG: Npt1/Npt2 family nucleotide transporter [Candidatus Binatia bacterium]